MPREPNDYALVIGLNHYPQFGAKGRPLEGAIKDAERFARWLKNDIVGGGLDGDHCELILSTLTPLQPRKEAIDDALSRIWKRALEQGGRRLYFYFSGHGQARSSDDVALCLCHWSSDMFRHAALSSERYRELFQRCMPFSELIVLLDCCRVRSVDAAGQGSDLGCPIPVATAGATRYMVGYAAEFQSAAMEAEAPTGVGVEEEGPIVRGHFTEALLAALYGGAARPEGGVPLSELKLFLEQEVPRIAAEHGHDQKAEIPSNFPGQGEPIFGSALPEANFEIEFSPERSGPILLEGPDLDPIREDDASTGPWNVRLAKGRHRLEERRTGAERYVEFRPAEEITRVVF
jgi:Caspase domain